MSLNRSLAEVDNGALAFLSYEEANLNSVKLVRHFIDLDPNDGVDCLGQVPTLVITSRLTRADCNSGVSCTTVDFGLPIGSCVIDERGNCKIKSSVNSLLPGSLVSGASTGIEVLSCNLVRISGAGSPTPTLACGVLVK